jgi:hypothetical protein
MSEHADGKERAMPASYVLVTCSLAVLAATVSNLVHVRNLIATEADKLNLTSRMNGSVLVFNRVPKVLFYKYFWANAFYSLFQHTNSAYQVN